MIVATLTDEHGAAVQSEKMVEIDFQDGRPVRAGDQFGVGRVTARSRCTRMNTAISRVATFYSSFFRLGFFRPVSSLWRTSRSAARPAGAGVGTGTPAPHVGSCLADADQERALTTMSSRSLTSSRTPPTCRASPLPPCAGSVQGHGARSRALRRQRSGERPRGESANRELAARAGWSGDEAAEKVNRAAIPSAPSRSRSPRRRLAAAALCLFKSS